MRRVSPVEIMEALDLPNINTVSELIQPLIDNGLIVKRNVYHGWFIEKK